MYLKRISDLSEITVEQLASFFSHTFSLSGTSDFVLLDINDTAENIEYKEQSQQTSDYYLNVNVKGSFKCDGVDVTVRSLIKGVYVSNGEFTVDVVKSVKIPLTVINDKIYETWLASSKCAAYLLCKARSLNRVNIRLICVHTENLDKREITITYNVSELETLFSSALSEWSKWTRLYSSRIENREKALQSLKFPFEFVRDGQDTIIRETSRALDDNKPLYINAPTGIGKTVAVLYPSFKYIASGKSDRIFYLTSKNSLHSVVVDACKLMSEGPDGIRVLSLVSKNKLCPKGLCNRKECPYTKGHSDRLKDALLKLVSNEWVITSDILTLYGKEFNICPFELARKAVLFSDVVVCDYNYIFDPYVSRTELFKTCGKDILLIDEAHNLVDRVKQMYSAVIDVNKISELKVSDSSFLSSRDKFIKTVNSVKDDDLFQMEPLDRNSVDSILIQGNVFFEAFQELVSNESFKKALSCDDCNAAEAQKQFNSFKRFISLAEEMDDRFMMFFDDSGNVKLSLVDTSKKIQDVCKKMGRSVFFSATLTPEEYYRYMLGAKRRDTFLDLESPFRKDNFKVISYSLSTRYSEREATLSEVLNVIFASVSSKCGNYLVFLPSYQYLNAIVGQFENRYTQFDVICEKPSMTYGEKNNFVNRFSESCNKTLVAFAVMGGSFSEGVDLTGERLSGAVIIGLGVLPPERSRELTARYFDDRFFDGTKFAYVYPGMNKVFQAGGRVIRSENDKGFLVVVDDRFLTEDYLDNLPAFWTNLTKAKTAQEVSDKLKTFWG